MRPHRHAVCAGRLTFSALSPSRPIQLLHYSHLKSMVKTHRAHTLVKGAPSVRRSPHLLGALVLQLLHYSHLKSMVKTHRAHTLVKNVRPVCAGRLTFSALSPSRPSNMTSTICGISAAISPSGIVVVGHAHSGREHAVSLHGSSRTGWAQEEDARTHRRKACWRSVPMTGILYAQPGRNINSRMNFLFRLSLLCVILD